MDTTTLAKLYAVNAGVLTMTLDGISHDESVVAPAAGGNCINWIVGHIALYRGSVLELLGRDPIWDAAGADVYRRGEAMTDPAAALPLETLVDAFARSSEPVADGFASVTPERLAAKSPREFPGGLDTIGGALAFLHFHEAYHLGQISLLRRLPANPAPSRDRRRGSLTRIGNLGLGIESSRGP